MSCPHCASPTTALQHKTTALGYQTFRCSACRRAFNERTDSPFNFLEYPTDVVLLVVLWRLHYKLSLRDLAEMFLERGFVFTYSPMKPCGNAKSALRRCSPSDSAPNGAAKLGCPGMSMKPTSRSRAAGATLPGD